MEDDAIRRRESARPSRDLHGLLTICPPVLRAEDVQKKVPVVLDLTSQCQVDEINKL